MLINPKEIENIEDIGKLDKRSKVRLVKTIGGLHIAVGKEDTGQDKILAYSSHPAIVKHQLRKKFPMRFAENLNKSEGQPIENATNYSHNLNKNLLNGGYDIYALNKGMETKFVITHNKLEIAGMSAECTDISDVTLNEMQVKKSEKYKEFSQNDGNSCLLDSIKEYLKKENEK